MSAILSLLRVMALRDAEAIMLETGKVPSLRRGGNVEQLAMPALDPALLTEFVTPLLGDRSLDAGSVQVPFDADGVRYSVTIEKSAAGLRIVARKGKAAVAPPLAASLSQTSEVPARAGAWWASGAASASAAPVPHAPANAAVAAAAQGFLATELPRTSDVATAVKRWLDDPHAAGFLVTDGSRLVQLHGPSDAVLAAVPPEAPAAWRGLDVVLAHHGLLDRLWHRRSDPESLLIAHSVEEAVTTAAERSGVALLLRAPSPVDVAAVARAGARMPRKSTLFVPKPRTGLVLRPLAD